MDTQAQERENIKYFRTALNGGKDPAACTAEQLQAYVKLLEFQLSQSHIKILMYDKALDNCRGVKRNG